MNIKYTAFLDILGFSEYMKANINSEEKAAQFYMSLKYAVDKYLDDFKKENIFKKLSLEVTYLDKIQLEYCWISDTFVVSIKYELDGMKEDIYLKPTMIYYISSIVSQINHFFVREHQLCLRGAITSKFTYLKDRIILGEGIVDAHYLESKIASTPRIIFASDIISNEINNIFNEDSNSCVFEDCDGWYCVDFFNLLKENPPVIYVEKNPQNTNKSQDELLEEVFTETMEKYKDMINENLFKHANNLAVLTKYLWFKKYYDMRNKNEK